MALLAHQTEKVAWGAGMLPVLRDALLRAGRQTLPAAALAGTIHTLRGGDFMGGALPGLMAGFTGGSIGAGLVDPMKHPGRQWIGDVGGGLTGGLAAGLLTPVRKKEIAEEEVGSPALSGVPGGDFGKHSSLIRRLVHGTEENTMKSPLLKFSEETANAAAPEKTESKPETKAEGKGEDKKEPGFAAKYGPHGAAGAAGALAGGMTGGGLGAAIGAPVGIGTGHLGSMGLKALLEYIQGKGHLASVSPDVADYTGRVLGGGLGGAATGLVTRSLQGDEEKRSMLNKRAEEGLPDISGLKLPSVPHTLPQLEGMGPAALSGLGGAGIGGAMAGAPGAATGAVGGVLGGAGGEMAAQALANWLTQKYPSVAQTFAQNPNLLGKGVPMAGRVAGAALGGAAAGKATQAVTKKKDSDGEKKEKKEEKKGAYETLFENVYLPAFLQKSAELGINITTPEELNDVLDATARIKQALANEKRGSFSAINELTKSLGELPQEKDAEAEEVQPQVGAMLATNPTLVRALMAANQ